MPVLLGDTLHRVNTGQSIKIVWNFGTLVGLYVMTLEEAYMRVCVCVCVCVASGVVSRGCNS